MSGKIPFPSMAPGVGWLRFWLPLLALFLCGNARAEYPDIPLKNCAGAGSLCACDVLPAGGNAKYSGPVGTGVTNPNGVSVLGVPAAESVDWGSCTGANCAATRCSGSPTTTISFNGLSIIVPCVATATKKLNINGTIAASGDSNFTLTVKGDSLGPSVPCPQNYRIRGISGGTGWGDPHITTVDGVAYDFQGAGEFTALRGDGLEIQTRQTPVPTAPAFPAIPANAYTGLSTCVAIYTAVAARVGKHRVSYQPNVSGVPDPSGLQLRVDGVLTKLGAEGIDLDGDNDEASPTPGAIVERQSSGRIMKSPAGGGIEIHYADGTKLVVAPDFWPAQQKWYLNVSVYETTATKGIMGLTKDAWLPALPDGASLGPKPEPPHDRYVHVYEKFADAWRVTAETSLFTYKTGTGTKDFTNRDWPGENRKSCAIEGEPTAQPIDERVAAKHCSAVVDKNNKANCIFDVSVTGNPGFAQTYQTSEQLDPGLTRTAVKDDKDPTNSGESVTFTATVVPTLPRGTGTPGGTVQFILDGSNVGDPVTLDSNGRATWSTSSLQAGKHQIVGKYIPSGFGGMFLASSSPEESHTVVAPFDLLFWLFVLLIIVLIVAIVWWFRTR